MAVTKAVAFPRLVSGSARGKTYCFGIEETGLDAADLGQLRDLLQMIGAEHEIDERRPREQLLLLLLRDAAGDAESAFPAGPSAADSVRARKTACLPPFPGWRMCSPSTRSAPSAASLGRQPARARASPMRCESDSFIWQPKVWMK